MNLLLLFALFLKPWTNPCNKNLLPLRVENSLVLEGKELKKDEAEREGRESGKHETDTASACGSEM